MHGRGGFPLKNIIYAVFIALLIYMTYLYNHSQNHLREAEMTGARYKRESDERVTEIQELVKAKDKAQENCQNEKYELNNRIKSINQQHSMLQGQYREMEADFLKLKDDMEKLKQAHSDAESQHAQEYQLLKQNKENELTSCRDDLANSNRLKNDLETKIAELNLQIKKEEAQLDKTRRDAQSIFTQLQNEKQQLQVEIERLQKQQVPSNITLYHQQQPEHQQNPQLNLQQPSNQREVFKQDDLLFNKRNQGVDHMNVQSDKVTNQFQGGFRAQGVEDSLANRIAAFHSRAKDDGASQEIKLGADIMGAVGQEQAKPNVDDLNAQHQVKPPVNQGLDNDNELIRHEGLDLNNQGEDNPRPDVNPNDEQRGQILDPVLQSQDKVKAVGDLDLDNMNSKKEDTFNRGRQDEDEDLNLVEHKNPLALGQIQGPQPGIEDMQEPGDDIKNNKDDGQQVPPLLNDDIERNNENNGENQYFGEEENNNQQDGGDGPRNDEQDRDGRDEADNDHNADQFQDENNNQENDNAALEGANN